MRDVAIVGVGMTPVKEHWDQSLRELAAAAILNALSDADVENVDFMAVGNAYGSTFNHQTHLGALIADYVQLEGVEAYTSEAGDASGGVALRTAYLAVASGAADVAVAVGVENVTDIVGGARYKARNISLDADYEAMHGVTLPAMAGLLMRRYMHEYGLELANFEPFSINAHANGKRSEFAMFRNTVREGSFAKAPMVSDPVNLFDSAPDADGAAAVVLMPADMAQDRVPKPVHIAGSAVSTDRLMLQERADPLYFASVARSVTKALKQAGLSRDDVSLFELHDAFTIVSALSLEAAGYAERGQGWQMAQDAIGLKGRLPISTFGGLKSRGNPAGATGIYQAVEATLQLRGEAGSNQVENARIAMIQNMGGLASTTVTHVLKRV